MDKVSYVGNADVSAIDHLYQQYRQDPESVDIGWKKFFEGFDFARTNYEDSGEIPENFQKEFKVINLINGYRSGFVFIKLYRFCYLTACCTNQEHKKIYFFHEIWF